MLYTYGLYLRRYVTRLRLIWINKLFQNTILVNPYVSKLRRSKSLFLPFKKINKNEIFKIVNRVC